jgi:hypothetical protein
MKFLTAIFVLLQLTVQAQRYATTDEGLRVQLNDDGTWVLLEKDTSTAITVNPKAFTKPSTAIAVKKSVENNTSLNYNPVKWKSSKDKNNEDAEFEFDHVKGNAYAMMITEKIEIPLESLKNIFFENLLENAPDAKINNAEYRTVNGLKLLHMEVSGTMQGIKFVYFGYFFSNEKGTTQLVCYTAKSLLNEYKTDFEDILNGLSVVEK